MIFLCFFAIIPAFIYSDSVADSGGATMADLAAQLQIINSSVIEATSRAPTSSYQPTEQRILWLDDLFNYWKLQELRKSEKDAYLFYMSPPSQSYYTSIYAIARKNYMLLQPFTFYSSYSGLSQLVEKNYIYTNNLYFYKEFLAPSFINPEQVDMPIYPGTAHSLPRNGRIFQTGKSLYDNLIHTSSVQDMVFKHFYYYCPEEYQDVCEVILSSTASGVFSPSGMASTSPNGDMNPESLLAEPGYLSSSSSYSRAKDFIQNITDPYPKNIVPFKPDPYTPGVFTADTTDTIQIAKNIVDKSYRGLSQYVLNEIKNRRVQSTNPDQNASSGAGGSLSTFQFLYNMANNRMLTSNAWLTEINVASNEALLREIVLIEASRLLMDFQIYRQNEHMEALLAAMVSQNQNLLEALNFAPDTAQMKQSLNAIG